MRIGHAFQSHPSLVRTISGENPGPFHRWMEGIHRLFASKFLPFAPIGSKLSLQGAMSPEAEDEFVLELAVKLFDFGRPT